MPDTAWYSFAVRMSPWRTDVLEIKEVKTKRDIKEFIEFPLRLYRGCEYFVPAIYSDEKKLLAAGGQPDIAETVFFLAIRDGATVGRIQGILQKEYNRIHSERRIRFTRFDSIDDKEVSRALFSAVEAWGKSLGMDTVCGPLGYSDLDREGLLIEGFDENQTFEEQYNYPYYPALIEDAGYSKEVDWLEFELRAPDKKNEMLTRIANRALELNRLHVADTNMSKKAYIDKYADGAFACIDECYSKLYGTVPLTPKQRKELVSQFMMILNPKYLVIICDENERVVSFGLCFPAIGDALKKSGGRLTPAAIVRLLRIVKNPKTLDLGLVAVLPEYQNSGINAIMINTIAKMFESEGIEKFETNLCLETNSAVIAQWKHFSARQHKRRRSYKKLI